jgi:hypothetical protein
VDVSTISVISTLALVGYGEVQSGRPTWSQRELQTYTNLVRVDPTAWDDAYGCSSAGFSTSERSAKAPLLYHDGLTEIAQLHSEDMAAHGFMDHDSWNGTSFSDRVWPYYPGSTIGENVAYGYQNNAATVWQGWMCSAGHRANIMSAAFTDIGCGVQAAYYTQDFGGGAGQAHQSVAMGVHSPEHPTGSVDFWATFDAEAPRWFGVETDTDCIELERIAGTGTRGGWHAQAQAGGGCVPYRFRWETSDGAVGVMPGSGAYQYGSGCALWVAQAPGACGDDPGDSGEPWDSGEACAPDDRNCDGIPDRPQAADDLASCGCGVVGSSPAPLAGWLLSLTGLGVLVRRSHHSDIHRSILSRPWMR